MKEKIDKLIAHERSARALGNEAEADAFKEKIAELRGRETESAPAGRRDAAGGGRWVCSCGYELVLTDDRSAGAWVITDIMLSPHRGRGHQLNFVN